MNLRHYCRGAGSNTLRPGPIVLLAGQFVSGQSCLKTFQHLVFTPFHLHAACLLHSSIATICVAYANDPASPVMHLYRVSWPHCSRHAACHGDSICNCVMLRSVGDCDGTYIVAEIYTRDREGLISAKHTPVISRLSLPLLATSLVGPRTSPKN